MGTGGIFPAFLDKDLPEKERASSLMGHAGGLATIAGCLTKNPTLKALGLLAYMGRLHAEGNGNSVQQPDDFGNYYDAGGVKRDAETERRVDEMTNRVLGAGWY